MTRTRLVALSALTALTIAGCGSQGDSAHQAKVVATTNVWGSVATAVAGGHADVKSILTNAAADPHSYEASPADAAAIADATLVVINGGGYDHWADDVLKNHKNVTTVDAYSLLPHSAAGEANEHVFYNMAVAKAVAAKIADDLAGSDPAHADAYRANAAEFGKQTDAIAATEHGIGQKHPGAAVVATEPVAHYLLAAAGVTDSTPHGFAAAAEDGHDPAPADVAAMLDLINGHKMDALVVNKQTETAVTKQLQDAANKAALPIVEVTETLPDGQDFLTWQRQTAEALAHQLDAAPVAAR
ncbi:metal ABC transporter solute-binding protein, Zn/Mn family [Mycolicibacterium sp. CBMA 226]|uniref:metal ABC transporter solute-binding protein, Zn/Mn family n=1 Tax=Mycolicibacterium sp. CBMA 226 TaxID=2606611 RepID=UPI0012DEB47B|nr:zinc ABC transporter substrate-binding protein [Mycolicibacterium sp. CBMA 226]MUL79636.1 ABC transporter substrate-binding protein [Mycolicibacterium sp. CBMA 226]